MKKALILTIVILLGIIIYLLLKKPATNNPSNPESSSHTDTGGSGAENPSKKDIFSGENKESIKEDSEHLTLDVSYPSFKNEKVSATVKNFIESDIAAWKTTNDPEKLSPEDKSFLFQNGAKWSLNITYKTYEDKNISSVVLDIADYTGGAHGGLAVTSLNFDKSGETLMLGDLFKEGTNYLSKLSSLSKSKLEASVGKEGTWITDGTKPITDNFKTFYLRDGNLYIIFQPYQVAPWVNGTPEIKISPDEIKDIIKENIF